jgi:ketosteroid isomerase-like protein
MSTAKRTPERLVDPSREGGAAGDNPAVAEDTVDLILRGWRAFVAGEMDVITTLLDPEVEWIGLEQDATDRPSVLQLLGERLAEGYRVEIEECIAVGDDVVVCFRAAGMEQARRVEDDDGRTVSVSKYFTIGRYFAVVTVRDGKVIRVQDYPQRTEALEAVGIDP